MPRQLQPEEKAFDTWLASQSKAVQRRYRKAGIKPYSEMPCPDNVFPVKETHPAFGFTRDEPEPEVAESTRFISEHQLRPRLYRVLEIVAKYADKRTQRYLLFVRTLLGENTGVTVGNMAREFKVTRQCMNHRARMILAALDKLAADPGQDIALPEPPQSSPPSHYRPRTTRDTYDDEL